MTDELREALADYAHEAWSRWMRYLFSKSQRRTDEAGTIIPANLVERWRRQLNTPYAALPEEEKESDRAEADTVLKICRQHTSLKFTGWFLGNRSAVEAVLIAAKRELKHHRPSRELDVADVMDALDKAGLLR